MKKSKGSEMMRERLSERGKPYALARTMGIRRGRVHEWMTGKQAPLTKSRLLLWRHLGIPIEAWDEETEVAK